MSPLVTQRIAQTPRWAKNELWRRARAVPSLDLRFADNKSLVDAASGAQLVTFSRASGGTYVDSQGVIRNAVTNLNTNSEAFNTYTTASGSVVADQGVAPNGTLTADELTSTGGGVFKSISGLTSGATYVISVYAKYLSGGTSFLFGFDANPSSGRAVFNLQTGAFVSAEVNVGSYTITPVGNGWHRITVSAVATSTSAVFVFYNGTSGSKWLLWGAQLEQSSTVGEYVPTTSSINSAPRFDHNPTTGESLGLLVEESRSNLLLNSGTLSTQNVTVTAVAHTLSFTGTGTITLSGTSTAGPLVGTGTGEANRVSLTFTPTAGTLTLTVSGTVTNAQLEIGAFRTSYIPTLGTAATRAADTCSLNGSILSSGGGNTLFAQFRSPASGTRPIISLDDNSANERIELFTSGTDPKLLVTDGGVAQADIDAGTIAANTSTRLAARFAANDFAASVGGNTSVIDTSGTMPTVDRVRIGANQAGGYLNGHIARITNWITAPPLLPPITQ